MEKLFQVLFGALIFFERGFLFASVVPSKAIYAYIVVVLLVVIPEPVLELLYISIARDPVALLSLLIIYNMYCILRAENLAYIYGYEKIVRLCKRLEHKYLSPKLCLRS